MSDEDRESAFDAIHSGLSKIPGFIEDSYEDEHEGMALFYVWFKVPESSDEDE